MSPIKEDADLALRKEFIDESLDGLSTVSDLFVQLESDPGNTEIVQSIFRPVHSLKGNATYFGLMKVKLLAHSLETLLDLVRKGKIAPSPAIVSVLLKGTDELMAILGRVRKNGEETPDSTAFDQLIQEVNSASTADNISKEALWSELLQDLSAGGFHHLFHKAERLAQLSQPGIHVPKEVAAAQINECTQIKQKLKAKGSKLSINDIKGLFQSWQQNVEDPRAKQGIEDAVALVELLGNSIGLDDPITRESLLEKCDIIEKFSHDHQPAATIAPTSESQQKSTDKTMRIAESKIDAFLAHVGELLTIGEMYNHLHTTISNDKQQQVFSLEFRRVNEAFSELSRSLQTSIMNIRKVPLHPILQKLPRIIRDIATARNKQIETTVQGGEISVDKSIADIIEAPLVHMARNSADHGIETPDIRANQGKPTLGSVNIAITETAVAIILDISDDGQGLDFDRLTQKAVTMGIIEKNATLSEQDAINLIFQSGVSTANEVSEISGRGVGMDVVKRAIEGMGGSIKVVSQKGKGSTFTIAIPKTVSTQIFNGFIVLLNQNRYVFPLDRIIRSFQSSTAVVISVVGKGLCVKDGDHCLPIVSLSKIFHNMNFVSKENQFGRGMFVVLKNKTQSFAAHVDDIEGIQQVVLKNIDGLHTDDSIFQGGAIMGDGNVAMVVDFDRVIVQ
jgi:two-component system chemotaxis sensor kinase CheA